MTGVGREPVDNHTKDDRFLYRTIYFCIFVVRRPRNRDKFLSYHTLFNINNVLLTAYKVIEIEGVGEVYAEKLVAAGISSVDDLLSKCAAPAGRKALAEETGISSKLILKWTNHADLIRIHGVGPQFAELLEAAGVDTVKELRHRKTENLVAKLEEVNAEKNLVNRVPSLSEVTKMIEEAGELEAVMTY